MSFIGVIYMYVYKNWPAVGVVLETKKGQHITRLTANCCCSCRQLVSLVSHVSSGPDWELGAVGTGALD